MAIVPTAPRHSRVDDDGAFRIDHLYLLATRREVLETLAQYLLVHETIDQLTLLVLLGDRHPDAAYEPVP